MTAKYIQVAVSEGASTATTLGFSSNTKAGNLICCIVANQGSTGMVLSNVSDNIGNLYYPCGPNSQINNIPNSTQMYMFFAPNIVGGNPTLSFSYSGTTISALALYIFELSGVNAYDNGASAVGTTANATCGPFNTNFNDEIIISATINSGTATSAGLGYTLIQKTSGFGDILQYRPVAEPSAQTPISNMSAQTWGIVAASFYNAPIANPTDAVFFGIM